MDAVPYSCARARSFSAALLVLPEAHAHGFHRVFAALIEWVSSRDADDAYEDRDFLLDFAFIFNPVHLRNWSF